MRPFHGFAGCILISTLLAGCVHHGHHNQPEWDRVRSESDVGKVRQLEQGDTVRITTKKNKVHVFRVSAVEPDAFLGWGEDDRKYRVPAETIKSLEVRRRNSSGEYWWEHALHSFGAMAPGPAPYSTSP